MAWNVLRSGDREQNAEVGNFMLIEFNAFLFFRLPHSHFRILETLYLLPYTLNLLVASIEHQFLGCDPEPSRALVTASYTWPAV
jgi:hypothetical protein